ncbi:MAG TPA: glycosyltransferase family 4 protein [Candidatus Woesebacteria bacterium]|nr:glycosyltransferase family 4 protein [Candidatus Woesebacteria bacterium]
MKICEYIPTASFFVGGGEVYPMIQAKALASIGEDVTLVVLKTDLETDYFKKFKEENTNIKFVYLESPFEQFLPYAKREVNHDAIHELYFSLSRSMSQLCCEKKFDAVIVHYGPGVISVPKETKEILFLHGVPSTLQIINKTAVLVADKLFAVSKSVAEGWKELFGINGPVDVLYNAVDAEKFYPDENIVKDIDLLYLGRLIEIKGVQYLLRAVAILNEKNNINVRLVIVGDGPYRRDLEKLTVKLGIEDNVEFLGFLDEEKKRDIYNRARICVFPSYAKEGVLTTMLEAAACGSAIVTTNSCGMIDFLEDGKDGLLCKPKDGKDLARKIEMILSDKELMTILGHQAREKIFRDWSWKKHVDKLSQVLYQLKVKEE